MILMMSFGIFVDDANILDGTLDILMIAFCRIFFCVFFAMIFLLLLNIISIFFIFIVSCYENKK